MPIRLNSPGMLDPRPCARGRRCVASSALGRDDLLLRERGRSVEAIGCAIAPRTVYEATLEGHRAARKLGAPARSRTAREALQSQTLA